MTYKLSTYQPLAQAANELLLAEEELVEAYDAGHGQEIVLMLSVRVEKFHTRLHTLLNMRSAGGAGLN